MTSFNTGVNVDLLQLIEGDSNSFGSFKALMIIVYLITNQFAALELYGSVFIRSSFEILSFKVCALHRLL